MTLVSFLSEVWPLRICRVGNDVTTISQTAEIKLNGQSHFHGKAFEGTGDMRLDLLCCAVEGQESELNDKSKQLFKSKDCKLRTYLLTTVPCLASFFPVECSDLCQ